MARADGRPRSATAAALSSSSLPSKRVRQAPEASLNATPNFACGTVFTMASQMSSTVLMKCALARNQVAVTGHLESNRF